jgi:NAD(P)-dependent dehydrogenase (short-subunit alcohol dehydrogenase family)
MKIIVIGGTGTLGKAIVKELSPRHEIIIASHNKGDIQVDITDTASINTMYKKIKTFDAVICAAGKVTFAELANMTTDSYFVGINDKLMGQVNLVLLGLPFISDKGSFTLTSGILNVDPIRMGSSAAMVNGGIEGFVKSAAIEMPREVRLNVVSPTVVTEAMEAYAPYFRGYDPVPAAKVALAFSKSVEGLQTGQTYKVGH